MQNMIYEIKKEQYDELLRISNNSERTVLDYYLHFKFEELNINGIKCNDNQLLSDFVHEFSGFMYEETMLFIDELIIINNKEVLYLEIDPRTDWTRYIEYWDNTPLKDKADLIVQSILEDKLNMKIPPGSHYYELELRGSKNSVIECPLLSIYLFDESVKNHIEYNLEDHVKSLICKMLNYLFATEYSVTEEEFIIRINGDDIENFIVYLPYKINIEFVVKDEF